MVLAYRIGAPKVARAIPRRCHVKVNPQLNQVRGHACVRNQEEVVSRSVLPSLCCDDAADRCPLGVGAAAGKVLRIRLQVKRVSERGHPFLLPNLKTRGEQIPVVRYIKVDRNLYDQIVIVPVVAEDERQVLIGQGQARLEDLDVGVGCECGVGVVGDQSRRVRHFEQAAHLSS